jgi:DNA-binding transcriptional MocR family regulator
MNTHTPRAGKAPVNMKRGLPSPEQIELARPFLELPGNQPFASTDGQDWLNYGGMQGLPEVRELFGPLLLGVPAEQVVVGENSSLALMHEAFGHAWVRGFPGHAPWGQAERVKFICPEPGYDRHFAICEYFGIEMLPIPLGPNGPDMDQVEALVASDPTIKGMWCVPRHANPNGAMYSAPVIQRLAYMPTAAPDFHLWWDNAYVVHDFQPGLPPTANILEACTLAGNPARPLLFASTSKMLIPGAGLAFFGACPALVDWWLTCREYKTIGPDKVNQVRHLRFFRTPQGVLEHMAQQGVMLKAKFDAVDSTFRERFAGLPGVTWSTPAGGYFICLQVPDGLARQVVELAREAGVLMTPAGATHTGGHDPRDCTLRIAPSYLELETVKQAAQVIAGAVCLACAGRSTYQK